MTINSSTIAGGGSKNEPFDYYPTPPDATQGLLGSLNLPKNMTVWECACGNGAMSKVLEDYGFNVMSSDIREDCGYGESGVDFFKETRVCDAIITNPPFGVAQEFIEKALKDAPIVCMLLKAHYWHTKKRFSLFQSNPPSFVLPLTWRPNFMQERGKSPTMDFQWSVWVDGDTNTKYRLLSKPNRFYLS